MRMVHILLLIAFMMIECSPVRPRYSLAGNQNGKDRTDSTATELLNENNSTKDTTIIYLEKKSNSKTEISGIDDAVKLFDKGKVSEACPKFRQYFETYSPEDSLFHEASFYLAECALWKNNLDEANQIYAKLLADKSVPLSVVEKALLRQGQVYCALDKKKEAEANFKRLKNEFPKSLLLKIANCSAVGK